MHKAEMNIWILVNQVGGAAAVGSNIYGFFIHPNASQVLWGSGTLYITASLQGVTHMIAPSAGGFLPGRLGDFASGVTSAALLLWAAYYAYQLVLRVKSLAMLPVQEVTNE